MSIGYQYYVLTLVVYFFQYIILELGYNLSFGLTGIINIALFTVVAFGGYIAAVVTMGSPDPATFQTYVLGAHLPFPLPILLGGIAGAILSALLGIVLLRLREQYQAIVSLVIAQVLWLIVGNWQPLFNGYLGLANIPQPLQEPLNLDPLTYQIFMAALAGVLALVAFLVLQRISHSPYGRTLRAVREDEAVAASLGKHVYTLQMSSLIAGGFLLGIGGALIAEYLSTISPSIWAPPEAFVVIATLLIGGTGSNWGAVVGAFVVPVAIYELTQLLPTFGTSTNLIDSLRWIVIGLLVLFFLWFRPEGLLKERKSRYPEPTRDFAGESGLEQSVGGSASA
jgi:branched-chain amino acid transport system permease protein